MPFPEPTGPGLTDAKLAALRPALDNLAKAAYHSQEMYNCVRRTIRTVHDEAPAFADMLASLLVVVGDTQTILEESADSLVEHAGLPAPQYFMLRLPEPGS